MGFSKRDRVDKSLYGLPKHVTLQSSVVGYVEETVSEFELGVGVGTAGFTVDLHFCSGTVHRVPHPGAGLLLACKTDITNCIEIKNKLRWQTQICSGER